MAASAMALFGQKAIYCGTVMTMWALLIMAMIMGTMENKML
jgi:hypothetical protein